MTNTILETVIYDLIVAASTLVAFMCLVFTLSNFMDDPSKRLKKFNWSDFKSMFHRKPIRASLAIGSFLCLLAVTGTFFFPVELTTSFIWRTAFFRVCIIGISLSILWCSSKMDDLELRIRQEILQEQQSYKDRHV